MHLLRRETRNNKGSCPSEADVPGPQASDLVSVPACFECNKDIRRRRVFPGNIPIHRCIHRAILPEFWAKAERGLKRSPRLQKTITDSLRTVSLVNAEGAQIGRSITIETNWERVVNFIAKCVRGLYFFELGSPLSAFVPIVMSSVRYRVHGCLSASFGHAVWETIMARRVRVQVCLTENNPDDSVGYFDSTAHMSMWRSLTIRALRQCRNKTLNHTGDPPRAHPLVSAAVERLDDEASVKNLVG